MEDHDSASNKNLRLAEDRDTACNKKPRLAEDIASANNKFRLAKDIVSACNKKPRRHKNPRSAKDIVSVYKRRMTEIKLIQQKRIHPKHLRFFDDGELPMTAEEERIYNKITYESEGFDAPFSPRFFCGGISPVPLGNSNRNDFEQQYCEEALRIFNSKNMSNYGFVELVKCTVQAVRGLVYYITFKAKDPSDQTCLIFETRVWMKIMNEGFEVELVRIKSTQ